MDNNIQTLPVPTYCVKFQVGSEAYEVPPCSFNDMMHFMDAINARNPSAIQITDINSGYIIYSYYSRPNNQKGEKNEKTHKQTRLPRGKKNPQTES